MTQCYLLALGEISTCWTSAQRREDLWRCRYVSTDLEFVAHDCHAVRAFQRGWYQDEMHNHPRRNELTLSFQTQM